MPSIANSKDGANTAFLDAIKDDSGPMGRAFEVVIAGNNGKRAFQTTSAWIENGCPLPKVSDEPAKSLSLDADLDQEEQHPTGIIFGFGTVH